MIQKRVIHNMEDVSVMRRRAVADRFDCEGDALQALLLLSRSCGVRSVVVVTSAFASAASKSAFKSASMSVTVVIAVTVVTGAFIVVCDDAVDAVDAVDAANVNRPSTA